LNPLEKASKLLACVACHGSLQLHDDALQCEACQGLYRIIEGNIIVFSAVELSGNLLEKTMYGPEYDELIDQVAAAQGVSQKDTVALDFGCGSSLEVFTLANEDKMEIVFGLDYDLAPLQIVSRAAKKKGYDNIFLVQFDRDDIPFQAEVFDLVTSHQAFEHVPRPDLVINELTTKMKPGTIMRADFPNGHSVGELLRELFHRVNRSRNPHISMISLQRAKDYFSRAGLEVEGFDATYALRGPLVYFIEGFVLRFLFRKHKIYSVRNIYRKSFWFRWLGKIDSCVSRLFPQLGQAFVFVLRKPHASPEI